MSNIERPKSNIMWRVKYLPGIALLILISCSDTRELSEAEREQVAAEVRTMLQLYADAVRENGLLAEFAYLDSSEDFFWVPPGSSSLLSYDSVAAIIRRNSGVLRSVDNVWDSLHVVPHTRFLATFTGTITSRSVDTSGKASTVRLVETGLVVRRESSWKLLSGQTSLLE